MWIAKIIEHLFYLAGLITFFGEIVSKLLGISVAAWTIFQVNNLFRGENVDEKSSIQNRYLRNLHRTI